MTNDAALAFLRMHQPLASDRDVNNNALFQQFDEARRFFTYKLDPRAISLLVGALGEGDGHGIYPMVEVTLQAYPQELVVQALKQGLTSSHRSVRYWSAQFAASYADENLLDQLVSVCRIGGTDERIAAVTAIEAIGTTKANERLRDMWALDLERPVREIISAALKKSLE